jgi:hypothetical protein
MNKRIRLKEMGKKGESYRNGGKQNEKNFEKNKEEFSFSHIQ